MDQPIDPDRALKLFNQLREWLEDGCTLCANTPGKPVISHEQGEVYLTNLRVDGKNGGTAGVNVDLNLISFATDPVPGVPADPAPVPPPIQCYPLQ